MKPNRLNHEAMRALSGTAWGTANPEALFARFGLPGNMLAVSRAQLAKAERDFVAFQAAVNRDIQSRASRPGPRPTSMDRTALAGTVAKLRAELRRSADVEVKATAMHEAAHCVVGHALGYRVSGAIAHDRPEDGASGFALVDTARGPQCAWKRIAVHQAGALAEGVPVNGPDASSIEAALSAVHPSRRDDVKNHGTNAARRILAENRQVVERLAKRIQDEPDGIDGDELHVTLRAVRLPDELR